MIPELILQTDPETGLIIPEIWEDIPDFVGIYQISNYGRVKSLFRLTKNGQGYRPVKEKIRSINFSKALGYWQITLKNVALKIEKRCYIHILVGKAFIQNPENKPEINHKDGDKSNAFVLNLEWATGTENLLHAHRTGLKVGYWKDKVIHNAKKVIAIQDTAITEYPSIEHCAKHFRASANTISKRLDSGVSYKNHLIYSS